jgi:hypothetical protein
VVYGSDDVEFEFAVRRGLEYARVDLDLLDTWTVELFQRGDDARFLPGTGRTIDEKMWEVTALCLEGRALDALCC